MKRSLVYVLVFSLGVIVLFPVGIGLFPGFMLRDFNFGIFEYEEVDFDYNIDFDYCETGCEEPSSIEIEIINNKIYFVQIYRTYCNADDDIFWLECTRNSTTVSVQQIFEPNGLVARCICPILITGVLGNLGNYSFTLAFISVNRYVDQTHIIQTFTIDL
ncbi:MAG TPA: hypothetical protein VMZ29_01110 [Candidatus Bathyarchaeia archaeon]|nr:hypothetical protein [Candidatus Bathyarchaeia archaeon]